MSAELVDEISRVRSAILERHGIRPGDDSALQLPSSALDEVQRRATISSHWALTSNVPVVGPLIVLVQRVLRIGLRWYINPIVEQQILFNDAVLRALRELNDQATERDGEDEP